MSVVRLKEFVPLSTPGRLRREITHRDVEVSDEVAHLALLLTDRNLHFECEHLRLVGQFSLTVTDAEGMDVWFEFVRDYSDRRTYEPLPEANAKVAAGLERLVRAYAAKIGLCVSADHLPEVTL